MALTIALTYDVFKIRKNYAAMWLGEERLSTRIQVAEWSVLKYWKGISIPEGEVAYKYILERALEKLFPVNKYPKVFVCSQNDQPAYLPISLLKTFIFCVDVMSQFNVFVESMDISIELLIVL